MMKVKLLKNKPKILILGLPGTGTTITFCFMQNIKNGLCMVEPHSWCESMNDVNVIRYSMPCEGDDAEKMLDAYDKSNIKIMEDIVPKFVTPALDNDIYNFGCIKETYYPETNPLFTDFCPILMRMFDVTIFVWMDPNYIRRRGILVPEKLALYEELNSLDMSSVRHLIYERFCADPQDEINRVLSGICKISGYTGKLKPYAAGSFGYRKAVGSDTIKKTDAIVLTQEEMNLNPRCSADDIYEFRALEANNF